MDIFRFLLSTVCLLGILGSAHATEGSSASGLDTSALGQTGEISQKGKSITPEVLAQALSTVNAFLAAARTDDKAPGYALLSPASQGQESRAQWSQLIEQVADKFGKRGESRFDFALETDDLPGAPPGEYVVVGLDSTFAKASLAETLILKNVAGRYLIAGYHFREKDADNQPSSSTDQNASDKTQKTTDTSARTGGHDGAASKQRGTSSTASKKDHKNRSGAASSGNPSGAGP